MKNKNLSVYSNQEDIVPIRSRGKSNFVRLNSSDLNLEIKKPTFKRNLKKIVINVRRMLGFIRAI